VVPNPRITDQRGYFEALFRNSPVAIVVLDSHHKVVSLNPAFKKLFGFSLSDLSGRSLDDFIADRATKEEARSLTDQVQDGGAISTVGKRKKKNGKLVDVEIKGVPVIIKGSQVGALGLYIDISEQIKVQQNLAQSQIRYKSLFDYSPVALWEEDWSAGKERIDYFRKKKITDLSAFFEKHPREKDAFLKVVRAINFNQGAEKLFAAKSNSELVKNFHKTFTNDSFRFFIDALCAFYAGKSNWSAEAEMKTITGETKKLSMLASIPPFAEQSWELVYLSALDVTETRYLQDKLSETFQKMEVLAMTDELTGLLNRRAISARLEAEISRCMRGGGSIGVALVDLDKLKTINDTFGHMGGDQAIKETAIIIREGIRKYDMAGRWGGDEFLILFPGLTPEIAKDLGRRICNAVKSRKTKVDGQTIDLAISMGIYIFEGNQGAALPSEVVAKTDAALYDAKSQGRNRAIVRTGPL
jgi:diguanylate cyclase (GGDEF)-like protein/PAS domain S-box-containing protein